jgi:G-protein alpha subunit
VPTDEDILRSRFRTIGIHNIPVNSSFSWSFIDTDGERSERRKWIHFFENVTAVLFVVALPDYKRSLFEYGDVVRLKLHNVTLN